MKDTEVKRTLYQDSEAFKAGIEVGNNNMHYKVGDRVRIKSIDWYNENKNRRGYVELPNHCFTPSMAEYCGTVRTIASVVYNDYYLIKDSNHCFCWTDEMIEGLAEEEETNQNIINSVLFQSNLKYTKVSINTENYSDKVEIGLSEDYELRQEGEKWFAVKKKPKYPQTYEECCKVLCCKPVIGFSGLDDEEENLYGKFIALKRCRDAYWKIAGEEMGLWNSWEPDWKDNTINFTISHRCNEVFFNNPAWYSEVLAFPTEEIRDAFYGNFKDLIEECKELL